MAMARVAGEGWVGGFGEGSGCPVRWVAVDGESSGQGVCRMTACLVWSASAVQRASTAGSSMTEVLVWGSKEVRHHGEIRSSRLL